MILNRKITLLFLLTITSAFSQIKEVDKDSVKTHELEEVIITATRTIRQLSSLPLPVTLISKKQIVKTGSTRLANILNEQTGMILVILKEFNFKEWMQSIQ